MNEGIRKAIRLIKQGEGQFVEFKKKVSHPEKIVREVVAFANSRGGHLFIGVEDSGKMSGLKFPEDDEYVLSKAIKELCHPKIGFSVKFLQVGDVEILHYQIAEGLLKPYFAFLEKRHRYGKSFVRVEDHSIQASYEMRQILKRSRGHQKPMVFEGKTQQLFDFFKTHSEITLSQFMELSGMDKKLASNKLIDLSLSGALKIHPREGEDVFSPVE